MCGTCCSRRWSPMKASFSSTARRRGSDAPVSPRDRANYNHTHIHQSGQVSTTTPHDYRQGLRECRLEWHDRGRRAEKKGSRHFLGGCVSGCVCVSHLYLIIGDLLLDVIALQLVIYLGQHLRPPTRQHGPPQSAPTHRVQSLTTQAPLKTIDILAALDRLSYEQCVMTCRPTCLVLLTNALRSPTSFCTPKSQVDTGLEFGV